MECDGGDEMVEYTGFASFSFLYLLMGLTWSSFPNCPGLLRTMHPDCACSGREELSREEAELDPDLDLAMVDRKGDEESCYPVLQMEEVGSRVPSRDNH
jgi:hypothetical protein